MAVTIRVIPCLDVSAGRVVKGVKFTSLRDAGDPTELAALYDRQGADELTFLDISASRSGRAAMREVIHACAGQVFVPLTVGGGIRSVEDVADRLRAGADKVSVNTSALADPTLIDRIAARFGAQVLVLSVDARRCSDYPSGFEVTTHGGTRSGGRDALQWAREGQERGCGEILLNSMDTDGVRTGFDLQMISAARERVDIPLIASGGAGKPEHFVQAVRAGADAVLAASVFHYRTLSIRAVKEALREAGFPVRLEAK